MANEYQYEEPRIPERWGEAERRYAQRVINALDDLYSKFRNTSVTKTITQVLNKAADDTASRGELSVYSLSSVFARMTQLSAAMGTFDFETVQHLVSSAMTLEQGAAGLMSITNLFVKYSQISEAVLDNVVVKCTDGNYYEMSFSPDGTITPTQRTDITPEEIQEGFTRNAEKIVALDITTDELYTGSLKASYALLGTIQAMKILANEAFVRRLYASEIFGSKSLEQMQIDIDDESTLRETLQQGIERYMDLKDPRGFVIRMWDADMGKAIGDWENIINEESYQIYNRNLQIVTFEAKRDTVTPKKLAFTDANKSIVMKADGRGGVVFVEGVVE